MATRTANTEAQEEGAKAAGISLLQLILSVAAAVLVCVALLGGAGFWLLRSGHLAGGPPAKAATEPAPAARPLTTLISLEPFVVNLADSEQPSYLRVAVTLRLEQKPVAHEGKAKEEKPEKGKAVNEFEAAERDALLAVLGRQTAAALLTSEGKEQLKRAMLQTLGQRVPEVKVDEVLFTEFLVQR